MQRAQILHHNQQNKARCYSVKRAHHNRYSLPKPYDEIASALYIKVGKGKVEKTEEISPSSFVDYDKNGGIIGIEMLNTKKSKANKITLD